MSIHGRLLVLCLLACLCWLAPQPAHAQTVNISVNSAALVNNTGVHLKAGQKIKITATGTVNIADTTGGYITDPSGTIVVAPAPGTTAYNYFTNSANPTGVPPTPGIQKTIFPGFGELLGNAPYGSLIAGMSPNGNCCGNISAFTFIGTSATYTAPEDGFLLLGVDDVNNGSDDTGSFSATIIISTPTIASVEFTQAIQQFQLLADLQASLAANGEPPVPIIADKPAAIRVYFDVVTDATDIVLAVSGDAVDSKIVSLQPDCDPASQREHLNGCQSVDFFYVPSQGTSNVVLTLSDDAANQLDQETFNINTRTTNNIKLKSVKGCAENPTFAVPPLPDSLCGDPSVLLQLESYLAQVAPVVEVIPGNSWHQFTGTLAALTHDDYFGFEYTLAQASNGLYTTNDQIADLANGTWTDYFAIYPSAIGDTSGVAADIPSHGAVAPDFAERLNTDASAKVVAHETGHTLNLKHTNLSQPATATSPGCYGLAGDPSTYWPFPDNLIQSSTGVYEYGYNVDAHTVVSAGVEPPTGTFELMSYCVPTWITPVNYERMIATLGGGPTPLVAPSEPTVVKHNGVKAAARVRPRPELSGAPTLVTGPYWQISGTIDPTNGVAFHPVFMQNRDGSPDAGTGTYSIEILGAANQVLYTRNFTPLTAVGDGADGTTSNSTPYFSEWVPVTAGAASFAVLDPNSIGVGALPITGVAPVVTITSPAAGFIGSGAQQTISWTVQEPNVTSFTSRVLYSPDNGTTWFEQGDTTGTSVTEDFTRLPGSTTALIQVLASDGVNTGGATSALFTVVKKSPSTVVITNPPAGYAQAAVDPIILRGGAFDPDDGFLTGTALSWSSDIQGALGTGSPLIITLNPGTHKITLTGTDSDGNAISTSVSVVIGGGRPTLSLTTSTVSGNCISATVSAGVGTQGAPLSLVQYSLDGGATYLNIPLGQLPFSFVVPGSGTVEVVARAYDLSNQLIAQSAEIAIPAACVSGTPSISGGGAQSAVVGGAFANPLAVLVSDVSGNPVSGVTVNFTAPSTGASATLSAPSATTNSSGIASVTATANSTNGTYNVVAAVAGFSTSAQYTLTNTDFSVSVSNSSPTVKIGSSTIVTFTVTPLSGFNSPVTFACGELPDGVTCAFGSPTAQPSGQITTVLTITVAKNAKDKTSAQRLEMILGSSGIFAFCFIAALGPMRRKYFGLMLLMVVAAFSSLMAGCGHGSKPFTAAISVTASAGPLQHATPVNISVQ